MPLLRLLDLLLLSSSDERWYHPLLLDVDIGSLSLPNCSTLSLQSNSFYVREDSALPRILNQLSIIHLRLTRGPLDIHDDAEADVHYQALYHKVLGLDSTSWPNLQSIEFDDILITEGFRIHEDRVPSGLALRTWPSRILVVRFDTPPVLDAPSIYYSLFGALDDSYPFVDRIEMTSGSKSRRKSGRRERRGRKPTG